MRWKRGDYEFGKRERDEMRRREVEMGETVERRRVKRRVEEGESERARHKKEVQGKRARSNSTQHCLRSL